MADRLDILIFGATGFTGKHTIPAVHKLSTERGERLTWGVAGRSETKLKEVLDEMSTKIGSDLSAIPKIIADVTDESSLLEMTARAKIIINACGPYRFYGEPVIKACLASGTHHVDVSGEPQYMETMQLKYHKDAVEKGIYIVSACGFDSVPVDLGVCFLEKKFPGTLNSVESYLEVHEEGGPYKGPAVNYGTWESAVYGLAHYAELRGIRQKLFPQRTPTFKPKLAQRSIIHKSEVTNKWSLPFLGSDRSVVQRTQRYFYDEEKKRPVQLQCYFCVASLFYVFMLAIFGGIFSVLTKFQFGRSLLLKYPSFFSMGFFSHENPNFEKCEHSKVKVTLIGKGWSEKLEENSDEYTTPPTKQMIATVKGTNPGYGLTCVSLAVSAVTILEEHSKMPNSGGVYPPGAAFAKTNMIDELHKHGLTFEVVSESELKTTDSLTR